MNHSEEQLFRHLMDVESLDVLARENFQNPGVQKVIHTEIGRKLATWSLDYYWKADRKLAPSKEMILETWGKQLADMEISLGDPTEELDSIDSVVEALRLQHALTVAQEFVREFATDISTCDPVDRVQRVLEGAQTLYQLSQTLTSQRHEQDAAAGFSDALMRHEVRRESGHLTQGMTLGLPPIDQHIYGVHPGELAFFAMKTGGGKSWLAGKVLWNEFECGRKAVLVTMENDLPMTFDRLACQAARVDYEKWQRGEASDGDLKRVAAHLDRLEADERFRPIVIMPEIGERDPVSIVRKALGYGAESIIVDQLSFVERVRGSKSRERFDVIAEILRQFKALINEGNTQVPMLILHQLNRDGVKAARKSGRHEMEDLANSAEVERIADHIWVGYQSEDHEAMQQAEWQSLKFRRGQKKDWLMHWRLGIGDIRVIDEIDRSAA